MSDDPGLYRAVPAALERSLTDDGRRRLIGRLVPYNEIADVVDHSPDGTREVYREGFRPGAFEPQTRSVDLARRVELRHKHDRGEGLGFLGQFQRLWDGPDGLYGEAIVQRSKSDDVDDLLASGVRELSVEFWPARTRKDHTRIDDHGVRWRSHAHLHQVALEVKGAYSRAEVLSFRAAADEEAAQRAADDAQAAAEAAEQQQQAEATREAETAAEAARERRRRWEQLANRVPDVTQRQADLDREYGITLPGRRG